MVELMTGNANGATMQVFDNQGMPAKTIAVPAEQQHTVIHINDLHPGMYYLKVVMNGNTLESKKFSKIK